MNVVFLPSSKSLQHNAFFDLNAGRDGCLEPFAMMKKHLVSNGHSVNTLDLSTNSIDIVIVFRIDANLSNVLKVIKTNSRVKIIYIVSEERVICPFHTKEILQSNLFDLVLTWDDQMVDGKYFLKYNYPNPKLQITQVTPFKEKKFIAIINGYKFSKYNKVGELYTKRIEALDYFSDKGCDLYGTGWEKCRNGKITNIYKGGVRSKRLTLTNYKFIICFENTSNEYGAITEKIFDCFAAGCVPIYWGAPNIETYIPKGCFIDFRNFDTYDDLYNFLNMMDGVTYGQYIDSIKTFMLSKEYDDFNTVGYIKYMEEAIDRVQSLPVKKRNTSSIKKEWALKILKNFQIFYDRKRLLFDLLFG